MTTTMHLGDTLARLTPRQALKLLGDRGEDLLRRGGAVDIDIDEQVRLSAQRFVLTLDSAEVTLTLGMASKHKRSAAGKRAKAGKKKTATRRSLPTLKAQCSCGRKTCVHVAAALSLLLEEKTALGLASPADRDDSIMTDEELVATELALRAERACEEKMRVQALKPKVLWSDYLVTNRQSGKTYRVALRGWEAGDSFCSCPDFRKNTLGTCKHILHVQGKVKRRFSPATLRKPFQPKGLALHLLYGRELELRLLRPPKLSAEVAAIIKPLDTKPIIDIPDLVRRLGRLERLGEAVLIYPDAERYLQQQLFQRRIASLCERIRANPAKHPLRQDLLKAPLLPYQLDGIAFAVGAGRAILADEMGLGKTIQGIGVAELLAREAGIKKVLVIAPASLKSQWCQEIERFSDRSVTVVIGGPEERSDQYAGDQFFTLCNYEQVLRDYSAIDNIDWDLIVLDEGQRIKNWQAKTSRTIKALHSPFALVLTGTPLENRLDDLYSVVEFIDDRRLGPDFRFYHRHRVTDEKGKVIAYKNLTELRDKLAPILLRRTRASVQLELPERSTEIIRIEPTLQQADMHAGFQKTVSQIVNKRFLTEMDLLRLQKALLMCRMSANSTFLVDKQEPAYSSKLAVLNELLQELLAEDDRKLIVFSEWTTMLDLIEGLLATRAVEWVRLDGKVPQKQRQRLVKQFQTDSDCRLFLTTNAGATGLNLQAANTVVNVDLPWNPALLEQRIARAHRMGQKRPIQVYLLVTADTLEERLLATLSSKSELFAAALDPEAATDSVDFLSGMEALKKRLEQLLSPAVTAPVDQRSFAAEQQQALRLQTREQQSKVAAAGGQLLRAAFQLLDGLLPESQQQSQQYALQQALEDKLRDCVQTRDDGSVALTINLPNQQSLNHIAGTLSKILLADTGFQADTDAAPPGGYAETIGREEIA